MNENDWQVYIIESSDSKLYTGITNNMEQRWRLHSEGKGARFFRGRQPKHLLYLETNHSRSSASQREAAIKKLSRQEKWHLIHQHQCRHPQIP